MAAGRRGHVREAPLLALLLVLVLLPAGFVAGATLKVSKGPTEKGGGLYVAPTNIGSWWRFGVLTPGTLPSGTTSVSLTPASPSSIAVSSTVSFAVNGSTAGAGAEVWTFLLSTSAPISVEVELRFNVSLAGQTTHVIAFVQTPSSALSSGESVRFYFVTGSVATVGTTVQSLVESSAQCTSVGVCP